MKVSVLGWELPPAFSGGLGIHTINLFTLLAKVIDLEIYVPDSPGLANNYPFRINRVPVSPWEGNYGSSSDFYSQVLKYNSDLIRVFKNGASIIHAHDWITFPAGTSLKRRNGARLVVTVHSTEYDRSGNFNPQERILKIEEEGVRTADAVIAVSTYTKKRITDQYGAEPEKVHVIHNGVTSNIYTQVGKNYGSTRKVLYFGRVTPQKGPKFFIEAAHKVLNKMKDVTFIMAGTGDSIGEQKALIEQLGISDNFEFTGFVSEGEAMKLYRDCDVFVLPAVSEPFGMTVLESMSAGTPAIISKTTGVGEALHNVLRTDFWDTDKMAEYILAVLKFRALREIIGSRGRLEALNFTWEKAALKTLEVYNSL